MKQFFTKLKEKIEKSLSDHYGADELSKTSMSASIKILIVSLIPQLKFLRLPAVLLMGYALFRCYSDNYMKRLEELSRYCAFKEKYGHRFSVYMGMYRDRKTVRYFCCNKCKVRVRVVKGRDKVSIVCPKCGREFIKK